MQSRVIPQRGIPRLNRDTIIQVMDFRSAVLECDTVIHWNYGTEHEYG